MTYRELVYMCLDEVKMHSDDSYFTEEHIMFLLTKFRSFLLKQRYSDVKKQMPESNYQTVELELIQVPAIPDVYEYGTYLRTSEKIPYLMQIGNPRVYPLDYYQGEISYITRDRMKYVGHNKFLSNIIYASVGPDSYMYLKSYNPQYLYMEKIKVTGIFQDCLEASKLQDDDIEDIDKNFPIEDALVPPLIETVVKELLGMSYRPIDNKNNATDDLSEIANTKQ